MKKGLFFGIIAALSVYNFLLGKQDADRATNQASTLTLSTIALSATEIRPLRYAYDAAGNRTSRTLVIPRPVPPVVEGSEQEDAPPVFDFLNQKEIKIYPNPTKGLLKVEIINFDSGAKGAITIFDASGIPVAQSASLAAENSFDLSRCAAGLYIMKLTVGNETSSWKIIKEN